MLNEAQLEARMSGIGGSDIGAILGLNKYRSALDVFMEKTGRIEPPDLSDNEHIHFGNVLEDVVAQEYARRQGVKVRRRNQMFIHKDFPWALANIDRSVDGFRKVLECKTADAWTKGNWGDDGSDAVPDAYLVQDAWYMGVLDYPVADLAVLIGGNDFRTYHFTRDAELEEMCFRKAAEFWYDHVLKGIPPEPTCDRDLETLYAHDNGKAILATPEIEHAAHEHAAIKAEIKKLELLADAQAFKVKAFMGDHMEVLVSENGRKLVTWKNNKDGIAFDMEAFKLAHPDLVVAYEIAKRGARPFLNKVKL